MNLLSHSITGYFIRQKIKRALVDIYPLYIVGNVQMSISYLLYLLVHNFVLQLKIKVYIHISIIVSKKGIKIWGQFFDY